MQALAQSLSNLSLSNLPSEKRNKSSDSLSTDTAVTAPEEVQGRGDKHIDHAANSTTRGPLIVPRKSRPKLEDQRSCRSDKDSGIRESNRKSTATAGQDVGASKKEHTTEQAIVGHGRRDKGKAVDRSTRRSLPEPSEQVDLERLDNLPYSGPLAHAEFERMKKEIEAWKKAAADNKKQAKKQAKLITTIESSLQCQICMDIIHRPYALSPCGHILCLLCLQEWFRKAPSGAHDDHMNPNEFEDDRNFILNRSKSCPCCRAVITRRPIPIFLVKAIATAFSNHKAAAAAPIASERSPTPTDDDPWKGFFYASDDDADDADDGFDEESDDEVYEDAIGWAMQGLQLGIRGELLRAFEEDVESESGSEFEVGGVDLEDMDEDEPDGDADSANSYGSDEDESVYVAARWEPPSVVVDPEMYAFNQGMAASILPMLRRGCTFEMIRLFEITYSHSRGLVANLPSLEEDFVDLIQMVVARNNRIFLGWNVHLDGEDYTGEVYMHRVMREMRENPEQWMWTERTRYRGAFDVKLMVRIEDVEDYDTTDTEDWLASDPYV
ncbi:hypothetical protein C0991_010877 [Blastosporella zonata]|nr:hypothetical protein C0991_010877 [Blastosporella zonata]